MLFQLVRPGHTKAANTVSIMSSEKPGWYLRHGGYRVSLSPTFNTDSWRKYATFFEHRDTFFDGFTAFRSVNYPVYYISVNNNLFYIRRFENTALFRESASFLAGKESITSFVMNIHMIISNEHFSLRFRHFDVCCTGCVGFNLLHCYLTFRFRHLGVCFTGCVDFNLLPCYPKLTFPFKRQMLHMMYLSSHSRTSTDVSSKGRHPTSPE